MTAKCFDDVLIRPSFSMVRSRSEVDTATDFLGLNLKLPVISANMDTISGPEMCIAMRELGGIGALHRFYTVEENIEAYEKVRKARAECIVSVGLGDNEFYRATRLFESGASLFLIDVAHAASIQTVEQYIKLREAFDSRAKIIVGNFADGLGVHQFLIECGDVPKPDTIKVGIGGGSLCTTRIVTGCGMPTLASVEDCAGYIEDIPIIADGGIRNSGDINKSLVAGASMVMLGSMFAGTDETPGDYHNPYGKITKQYALEQVKNPMNTVPIFKKYRGSASHSSYVTQGKVSEFRSAEGEETLVPYKGPVKNVMEQINGGLRSGMSYCNAFTLQEFRENATLIEVSSNSVIESKPHGKKQ